MQAVPHANRNSQRSIVWDFYKKRLDGLSVVCKLCKITSRHFGNTTNLISHLKRKHPVEFQKSKDERAFYNTLRKQINDGEIAYPHESTSDKPEQYGESPHGVYMNGHEVKHQEDGFLSEQERGYFNDALLDMIIMDFHHASIVKQAGFDYFTRTLCPVFTLPPVEDVAERLIPGRYYGDKNTVLELLDGCEWVGLSVTFHNCNLVTVSACFISDYKFKRYAISTKRDLIDCLSEALHNWKIAGKITAITIDDPEKQRIFNDVNQYEINVNNFKSISSEFEKLVCINKLEKLLEFFTNNQFALRELILQGGTDENLTNLKHINAIEWLIKNRQAISQVLSGLKPAPENLEMYEWETASDWLYLQQPIQKVLSELSNNCTISCLIPLYRGLQSLISKKSITTDFGGEMKTRIIQNVTTLADNLEKSELTAKACLLDPRFKRFGFASDECASKACDALVAELSDALKPVLEDAASPKNVTKSEDDDLWMDFNEKIAGANTSTRSVCLGIVQKYLAMPIVDRKSDPLDFWKEHDVIFPSLSKLAVKYLCVPAIPAFTEQLLPEHIDFTKDLKLSDIEVDRYIFLKSVLTDRYG